MKNFTNSEIKLSLKTFDRIKHFWENTATNLANNTIWTLYINGFPYTLNETPNEVADYETLENIIKLKLKQCQLADNELPANVVLYFRVVDYDYEK